MNTDPIADYLTRIRNACRISHPFVEVPASKLKVEMTKLLQREGYIRSYELREDKEKKFQMLRINLKYDDQGYPVIRKLQRYSRPGRRRYSGKNVTRVLDGAGVAVVSTNKGLLTDREARKQQVGGEVLCFVE